ncbi:MAG: class I SAM-dependent methyltransferase [Fuscovulum sp.]|nr:MAG: class I SAM-dependent methyltransferase [Fuscovulum sp.]
MKSNLDQFLGAYGEDFAYAFDNAIVLNWYPQRLVQAHPANSRVLELGIGHGFTCERFSLHFDHYEVVDGSPAMISQFRKSYPSSCALVHEGYFETFEPEGLFDLIVMGFVLEHVDDPELILKRFLRFLGPGGKIAVAVPNAESLHRRLGHAAGLLPDMMALGDGDLALGHLRTYTVATLDQLLTDCGYCVTRREGIFLKPFTTGQLSSLDLGPDVLNAMCEVGLGYPELSAALLFEATAT